MTLSKLLPTVMGILMSIQSFAQLKIVGQNAEAPESRIDYLEHPVSFEQFLPYYSRENSKYRIMYKTGLINAGTTVWPRNELIYVCSKTIEGFKLTSSSISVGLPTGYYNISGCLLCEDESKDIIEHVKAYLNSSNSDWQVRQSYSQKFYNWPSFQSIQESISTSTNPHLSIKLYILKNNTGEEYYAWPQFFDEDCYVIVDYYNYIQEQFKDQDFVFINRKDGEYVLDIFKNVKVPIQSAFSEQYPDGSFSEFEYVYGLLKKGKKYHCTDVLVNNNNVVLAVDDGNNNTFSIALNKSVRLDYSNAHLLQEEFIVYLHAEEVIKGDNMDFDPLVISPKELEKTAKEYARIKARQDAGVTRQQEQRRKDIIQRFGATFGEKILNHKLALGMTPEMCIESIGYPSRRYSSTSEQGTSEVFFYTYMGVYFSDGKIVRVDQVR